MPPVPIPYGSIFQGIRWGWAEFQDKREWDALLEDAFAIAITDSIDPAPTKVHDFVKILRERIDKSLRDRQGAGFLDETWRKARELFKVPGKPKLGLVDVAPLRLLREEVFQAFEGESDLPGWLKELAIGRPGTESGLVTPAIMVDAVPDGLIAALTYPFLDANDVSPARREFRRILEGELTELTRQHARMLSLRPRLARPVTANIAGAWLGATGALAGVSGGLDPRQAALVGVGTATATSLSGFLVGRRQRSTEPIRRAAIRLAAEIVAILTGGDELPPLDKAELSQALFSGRGAAVTEPEKLEGLALHLDRIEHDAETANDLPLQEALYELGDLLLQLQRRPTDASVDMGVRQAVMRLVEVAAA